MLRRPIWSATAAVIAGIAAAVALVVAVSLAIGPPVDEPAPVRSAGLTGAVTASKPGPGPSPGPRSGSGHLQPVRGEPSTGSGEPRTDGLGPDLNAWRAGGEPAPVAPRILARVAPRTPAAPPEKEASDAAEPPPAGGEARIESIEIDWDWSAGDGR
ncbi:MAG TPA: hypothetical protein VD838_01180 [Anaeromyxobacteraceae bacterium]|nr:hypothetical protein [Anaeromyxobacteraceae bacterium]